ncbi:MAG: hypothetical protein IPH54_16425 [Rhodoferax sp.]|nr:hypothetical protein [Rhodoferax sp.]
MQKLELQINETKTSVRNARVEQFDFLGYSFGLHYVKTDGKPTWEPAHRPSRSNDPKAKGQRHPSPANRDKETRDKLNRTLKGQAYFHYGSKRKSYRAVNAHVRQTVRLLAAASQAPFAGHSTNTPMSRFSTIWACMNSKVPDDSRYR